MNTLGLVALIASGFAIGVWLGIAMKPMIDKEARKQSIMSFLNIKNEDKKDDSK